MLGLGLRQVQDALNKKADEIQHQFGAVSDELEVVTRKILEVRGEDRAQLRGEQESLRAKQAGLADEINLWRDRARSVTQQRGEASLRSFLEGLKEFGDPMVTFSAEQALEMMDSPEEFLERMQAGPEMRPVTPAQRLLQRARTEYDLRGSDNAPRMRAAVEFANRPGVIQDDEILAEIETGMADPDPLAQEMAALTTVQIYRFRALRLAELDQAHQAVQRLAAIPHRSAVQALIEVVSKPRTGYLTSAEGSLEVDNAKSRMVALLRLVEWHTPDAQAAIQALRFDRDPHIVKAAAKSLELFPGEWKGSLKSPS